MKRGVTLSDSFNNNLKQIIDTRAAMEEMFKPYTSFVEKMNKTNEDLINSMKSVAEQAQPVINTAEILSIKLEPIKRINEDLANQIYNIAKPLQDIKFITDNLIIPNFFESYNSTRELVNNFEEYDNIQGDERLDEVRQAKEKIGEMPDIEEEFKKLNPEQIEQIKEIILAMNYEIEKEEKKEYKGSKSSTILKSLNAFIAIPKIPKAIREYYIIAKELLVFLKD